MKPCEQKNNAAGCPAFSFVGCDVRCRAAIRFFIRLSPIVIAMSYLSVALQRRIERRQLTQSDVAKLSGISKSYISRLFSGEFHELSDANFTALLKVFSADSQAQAEIIAARCMDARVGPGSELVEIMVKKPASNSQLPTPISREFPVVELSAETERAFAWLRSQCPLNPDLEKHLVGYAKLTGMK
jgi:transcriptional regulator with XRE-family HTH domain